VNAPELVQAVQDSAVAQWMRHSLKAMPIVEATHVLAVALVFGTVLVVDLRLLGIPDSRRPFTTVSREMLRMTWCAFLVALITGALMFAPNALTYYDNTAFRLKLLALAGAGINMAIFELLTIRSVAGWNQDSRPPPAARTAALLSIVLWIAVIFLGRWIGFSKGYDFAVPEDVQFEFPQ
jgi:hypothetical protein